MLVTVQCPTLIGVGHIRREVDVAHRNTVLSDLPRLIFDQALLPPYHHESLAASTNIRS